VPPRRPRARSIFVSSFGIDERFYARAYPLSDALRGGLDRSGAPHERAYVLVEQPEP
jgi:hypothetical protein